MQPQSRNSKAIGILWRLTILVVLIVHAVQSYQASAESLSLLNSLSAIFKSTLATFQAIGM